MTDVQHKFYKDVIDRYIANHSQEWQVWLGEHAKRRNDMSDGTFGTNSTDSMRCVGGMPARLVSQIGLAAMRMGWGANPVGADFVKHFPVFKMADKM